jgi:hypothetical protein
MKRDLPMFSEDTCPNWTKRIRSSRVGLICLALVAVLFAACRSPEKQVEHRMEGIRVAWETNYQRQLDLPARKVDWPTGLELLLAKNPKLRQARIDYTNSVENYRQIFRELIPTLNARASVSKQLASLNTLTFDDVTFSADSFFSIPGLVNFAARIYVAKLVVLRARAAYQLAEREQVIELYKLFTGVQEQSDEMQRLEIQRANVSTMSAIDPFTGRIMQTELKAREIASLKETRTFQQRAADLFADYSYRWNLITNGLPNLRYEVDPLPIGDTNRVAQLQMKLFALELEAARMSVLGIKMRYWPELNIFVSGPPVYQQIRGQGHWWDASQVRGTADLYWQLDTRGYITRQLKQTKRAQDLQMARFEQETLSLMDRLLFTQQLMQSTREQLERVDKQIQFLLAIPPSQNFLAVQKYAEDYRQLTRQQIQLRREMAEFNSLFWFMDEQAWPRLTNIPAP